MFFINLFIVLTGVGIFLEDVKERAVHWVLFPFFALLLGINSSKSTNLATFLHQSAYNLLFVITQFALLTMYLSVKNKRFTNPLLNSFGTGDLLLMLSLCFYFSFLNYLMFYTGSLILVILTWLVVKLCSNPDEKRIPLAGMQALIFIAVFIAGWIWPAARLNEDTWLTSKLILWM